MLGRSSQRWRPSSMPALAQLLRRDAHRWLQARADVVEPRLELGRRPPLVAVDDGGDDVTGLDRRLGPVVATGQLAELGADTVDEGIDVALQHTRHGAEGTAP